MGEILGFGNSQDLLSWKLGGKNEKYARNDNGESTLISVRFVEHQTPFSNSDID